MFQFKRLFTLLLLFISSSVFAAIKLPAIFGVNMVLQQQAKVPLWGGARKNGYVRITTSWNHRQYITHSDVQGHWKVMIQTPAAGGPYEIIFDDGDKLTLTNILIGEVWVCSGQSNMEIPLIGYLNTPILHSNDILMHADNPQLRLFHLQRTVANSPLSDAKGSWQLSDGNSAGNFSAVGFQFAQMLQKILNVPVGIIETSWGGTPIEAWMDTLSLAGFPKANMPSSADAKQEQLHPTHPSCLFNGMIAPIAGFSIKGIIWYQGERNAFYPYDYDRKMKSMVNGWRKFWKNDNLPFYYVQIAPYKYDKYRRDSVPFLREVQMKAQAEIPHSGMAVSLDVGNEFTVHPPDKTTIAKRLVYWALGDTYQRKGIAYKSPEYKSMTIEGSEVTISFNHASQGLTSFDKPLAAFEVAGTDKVYHAAEAKILGKGNVMVHSNSVMHPVAVRYAFKDWVVGNLYSTEGLPVAPFRTDNW